MENTIEFTPFPKMARYEREVIITEKLDGTNGCIYIGEDGQFLVGSRTRWITPQQDNYGFARWAYAHREELMELGPGRHFGEFWGGGIQRGYGLSKDDKRFSLFNTLRWCLPGAIVRRIPTQDPRIEKYQDVLPGCCGLVPELWRGSFADAALRIEEVLGALRLYGSYAAPGFKNPEGVVIFHTHANIAFKKTLEHDELPKSLVASSNGLAAATHDEFHTKTGAYGA